MLWGKVHCHCHTSFWTVMFLSSSSEASDSPHAMQTDRTYGIIPSSFGAFFFSKQFSQQQLSHLGVTMKWFVRHTQTGAAKASNAYIRKKSRLRTRDMWLGQKACPILLSSIKGPDIKLPLGMPSLIAAILKVFLIWCRSLFM